MVISFSFTEEQEDIRRAAREFAEKEFTQEIALECDRNEKYPMELVEKCMKLGFHSVAIPEEYGGGGYGPIEQMIVMEEFSSVNPVLPLPALPPRLVLRYSYSMEVKSRRRNTFEELQRVRR